MGFVAILLKGFEVILIIGLLVMILLMFGAVTYDLFKIVRNQKYGRKRKEKNDINLVLLHNFAVSDDAYCFSHSIK